MYATLKFRHSRVSVYTALNHTYIPTHSIPQPVKPMASSNVIEECEHSFSSPCSQVGCLHKETLSMKDAEQENMEPSAFLPDLAHSIEPHSESSAGARVPEPGSGEYRELDKYVPMKRYRPGKGEGSRFKVLVSETPVLITDLRLAEQNIAYETIFDNLPADKVNEFYQMHLQRLKDIREAIVASEAVMQRFQWCFVRHNLRVNGVRKGIVDKGLARFKEGMDIRAGVEEEGGVEDSEHRKVWEGFLAFRRALRESKKLQACERAVARLLVKCEDKGKDIMGFQKVIWQAD